MIVEVNDKMRLDRGSIPLISTMLIKNAEISVFYEDKITFCPKKVKIKEAVDC